MDKNAWNNFVKTNGPKSGSFLHSWEWGEFQESLDRKVIRILEDKIAAQMIKIPLKFGLSYFYIPKGPILNKIPNSKISPYGGSPEGRQNLPLRGISRRETKSPPTGDLPKGDKIQIPNILEFLSNLAKKEGAVFIRFEPEFIDERDIADWGIEKSTARQVQPNQTIILNLEKTFNDLLSQMHPKTRYNIHLAERHGVEIRNGNNFGEFLRLLKETSERDKFHLHPISYYKKMIEFFSHPHPSSLYSPTSRGIEGTTPTYSPYFARGETGGDRGGLTIKLWSAKYKNQIVAANLIGYFGDTVTYLHGASSYNWRNLMAPHLLQWQIIKNAKIQGYKFYDFWGIDEKKWPGVTRFKKGFGGEEIFYPGAFDLPIKKNWYKVYQLARKLRSL